MKRKPTLPEPPEASPGTVPDQPLRLLQATLIAVAGALRQQACDHDEELAAVLEQHGIKVLDALLPPD